MGGMLRYLGLGAALIVDIGNWDGKNIVLLEMNGMEDL